MTSKNSYHVFLSYNKENHEFVEALARRLREDARLSFWFGPWHSKLGEPIQKQMEEALQQAECCAVFISNSGRVEGWQNEQMRLAIQTRVEDDPHYRVIPVLLPGPNGPKKKDLPGFLRLHEAVEFHSLDDEQAFKRLSAGILGVPPIQIEGEYFNSRQNDSEVFAPQSSSQSDFTVNEELTSLERLLVMHKRNLYKLNEEKATYGRGERPLHLLNQIEAEEKAIEQIKERLHQLRD